MEKFLLSFFFLGFLAVKQLNAQPCTLSNLQITNVQTTNGQCYADVTFDMDRNNGNKFVYVHIWSQANFAKVDKSIFKKGAGPKYTDLFGSGNSHPVSATFAIDNFNSPTPTWSSYNYRPDPSVPVVKGSSLVVNAIGSIERYTITNVPLGSTGGNCTTANFDGAVWSTQANSTNSHIHCSSVGKAVAAAPLTITGSASCAAAKFTINIKNTSGSTVSGIIDTYSDNGGSPNNGDFDPANDKLLYDNISFSVAANSTTTITRTIPFQYLNYNVWTQVMIPSTTVLRMLTISSCSPLPVKFQSFTATRNKQNVAVKWQTASEEAILGFNVLRLTDDGDWKVVAYVPSQAAGGFSSQALSYQLSDVNAFRGISQYRIEEIAMDGKSGLSDIKMVRGDEAISKLSVYPNPSSDGRINVVFDNNAVRDITVTDLSGRIVKQLRGVSNNSVLIENLNTGFYNLQVFDRTTNETATEKLIIKMR